MKRLLLVLLIATTVLTLATSSWAVQDGSGAGARQSPSGLVIGAEIEGHVTAVDRRGRLVLEIDKVAGRPVRVGVEPGLYEVRLETRGAVARISVEVQEGAFPLVDRERFAARAAESRPPARPRADERRLADARHRMEARLGLRHRPSISVSESSRDVHTSSVNVGGGVEYLYYVASDVGVGVSATSLARGVVTSVDHEDGVSSGHATIFVPLVARWNFVRRLTDWRTVDPYVTASVGPVFRVDWSTTEDRHDSHTTADTATSIGGRLGLGLDVHLGSVWTLGLVGAWNWSDRSDTVAGYGNRDRGGELAFTMGWEWGRSTHRRR
jgi:hypothetical protein